MLPSFCTSACRHSYCDSPGASSDAPVFDFLPDYAAVSSWALGMTSCEEGLIVRAWLPDASTVWLKDKKNQRRVTELHAGDVPGLFSAHLKRRKNRFEYAFEVMAHGGTSLREDPYRFVDALTERLGQDQSMQPLCRYIARGAQFMELGGVKGTCFSVSSPARQILLRGNFYGHGEEGYPMRHDEDSGVWSLFMPEVEPTVSHRYQLRYQDGRTETTEAPYTIIPAQPPVRPERIPHSATPEVNRNVSSGIQSSSFIFFILHIEVLGHYFLPSGNIREDFLPSLANGGFTHLIIIPDATLLSELYPFSENGDATGTTVMPLSERYSLLVKQAKKAGLKIILFPGWILSSPEILLPGTMASEVFRSNNHCEGIPGNLRHHCLYNNTVSWLQYFSIDGLYDGHSLLVLEATTESEKREINEDTSGQVAFGLTGCPASAMRGQPSEFVNGELPGVTRARRLLHGQVSHRWHHFACAALFHSPADPAGSFQELVEQLFRQRNLNILLPFTHEIMYSANVSDRQRRAYCALMWACPGDKVFAGPTRKTSTTESFYPDVLLTQLLKDLNYWNRELGLREAVLRRWHDERTGRSGIIAFSVKTLRNATLVVVANTSSHNHVDYLLSVDEEGDYSEILNTDSIYYGGNNVGNAGWVKTGQPTEHSSYLLTLTVPASSTVYLLHREAPGGV